MRMKILKFEMKKEGVKLSGLVLEIHKSNGKLLGRVKNTKMVLDVSSWYQPTHFKHPFHSFSGTQESFRNITSIKNNNIS
jgi:hypothetical protein